MALPTKLIPQAALPDSSALLRHRGRFTLSGMLLRRDPALILRLVMAKVLVTRAEFIFDRDSIEYTALCEAFDKVEDAIEAPEYDVIVDQKNGTSKFERRR